MTDKPRIVAMYSGVQLQDARERLVIVFTKPAKRGVSWLLRDAKFQLRPDGSWERPLNPDAIFRARAICNEFYGEPDAD